MNNKPPIQKSEKANAEESEIRAEWEIRRKRLDAHIEERNIGIIERRHRQAQEDTQELHNIDQQKRVLELSNRISNISNTLINNDVLDISFNEENIKSILLDVLRKKDINSNFFTKLTLWIKENGNFYERSRLVEDVIAGFVDDLDEVDIETVIFISLYVRKLGVVAFGNTLALSLVRKDSFKDIYPLLNIFSSKNKKEHNISLHELLHFMKVFVVSIQNVTPDQKEYMEVSQSSSFFDRELHPFLYEMKKGHENYLIRKNAQDVIDATQLWNESKEGAISGIPGGSQDETIFTYSHLSESHRFRLGLGILDGYEIANPVVEIAPDLLGKFHGGTLQEVYDNTISDQAYIDDKQYIQDNDQKYNWIYDVLNYPDFIAENESNKLESLRDVWQLDAELKAENSEFYFDVSKINKEDLHPFVYADILSKNLEYIKRRMGTNKTLKARQLSELIELDPKSEYLFLFMTSLSIRKKIEDDFGFTYSDLTLREQFYFLTFLESVTLEQVSNMQDFVKKYGVAGLRTFLTTAYNPDLDEKILTFATLTDEGTVKNIFNQYARLLDATDKFRYSFPESGGFEKQVFESMIRRSAQLFFAAEQMAAGGYVEKETITDLEDSFTGIALLSEVIADFNNGDVYTFQEDSKRQSNNNQFFFTVLNKETGDEFGLKILVRDYDEDEYSRSGDLKRTLQARINIELELPDGHELENAFRNDVVYGNGVEKSDSTIRFGFDLDDYQDERQFSFDIGRNARSVVGSYSRSGDVVGRILDKMAVGGHHMTDGFSGNLSNPDGFAFIADRFRVFFGGDSILATDTILV